MTYTVTVNGERLELKNEVGEVLATAALNDSGQKELGDAALFVFGAERVVYPYDLTIPYYATRAVRGGIKR